MRNWWLTLLSSILLLTCVSAMLYVAADEGLAVYFLVFGLLATLTGNAVGYVMLRRRER